MEDNKSLISMYKDIQESALALHPNQLSERRDVNGGVPQDIAAGIMKYEAGGLEENLIGPRIPGSLQCAPKLVNVDADTSKVEVSITPEYLSQLLKDKKQIQAFPNVFAHLETLLDEEINQVRGNLFNLNTKIAPQTLPEATGTVEALSEKLYVPVKEFPHFNFVGRILGPRGTTAKQLEQETGCRIMVRGKGSMRDQKKEEMNRGKANWEHLNEDLHVLITVQDTKNRAEVKMARAVDEVKKLLHPAPEGEDDLKKMQLMELAIINGTYRDIRQTLAAPAPPTAADQWLPRMMQPGLLPPPSMRSPQPTSESINRAYEMPTLNSAQYFAPPGLISNRPQHLGASNEASLMAFRAHNPYVLGGYPILDYQTSLGMSAAGAIPNLRRVNDVREHPYIRAPLHPSWPKNQTGN